MAVTNNAKISTLEFFAYNIIVVGNRFTDIVLVQYGKSIPPWPKTAKDRCAGVYRDNRRRNKNP